MGVTPAGIKRRSIAPFGISNTEQKAVNRVPPILLSNEKCAAMGLRKNNHQN